MNLTYNVLFNASFTSDRRAREAGKARLWQCLEEREGLFVTK